MLVAMVATLSVELTERERVIVPRHMTCAPRSPGKDAGKDAGNSNVNSMRVCGSSGESPTNSMPERLMLVDVPNRHTSSPTTR